MTPVTKTGLAVLALLALCAGCRPARELSPPYHEPAAANVTAPVTPAPPADARKSGA